MFLLVLLPSWFVVKASQYGAPLLLRFALFQVWNPAPGLPMIDWPKDVVQVTDTAIATSGIRQVLGRAALHRSWRQSESRP
jgi:hypothetical protein